MLGALPYIVNLLMIGLAQNVWQLVGVLFLFGMSANLLNLANSTQAVGVEALYKRSIMSSLHGLWSLAGFVAAGIGTYFISQDISTFLHFCINGTAGILLLLVFYRFALAHDTNPPGNRPLFVWPDRTLLKLGIIGFCSMICEGTMFDWSGIYFTKEVDSPETLNNLGFVAFMATMTGGRFAGDWIVVRFGIKRVIQTNGLLIATGLLMAVVFPHLLTATLGFLLVGMGVSTIVPLVYSMAGKSSTMSAGMALAAVSSTGFLGFLLGPPLIGYIAEIASLRWSFGLIAMLGILTIWLIKRVNIPEPV
jgi:MFS family permease